MSTRSWNKAELIGNITRDPELRYTPSGAAVCTFSIATNRTYVVEGERKEDVDFHRIVAWNKLAELCSQLLKKGTKVFVSGRIQNRSWEGQDGVQKQTTEIVIEDMLILTAKGGTYEAAEEPTDDLPTTPTAKTSPATSSTPAKPKEEAVSSEPIVREPVKQEVVNDDDLPF